MLKMKIKKLKGITLIELMMTMLISSIVVLSMGILLADNLRGWRVMYNRIHSEKADNTYVVRRLFDVAFRKGTIAPGSQIRISPSQDTLTVDYYSNMILPIPDCNAVFQWDGSNILTLTCYQKTSGAEISSWTIPNVSNCIFNQAGRSVQMNLTFDDPNHTQMFNVVSSAYLHCE